MAAVTRWRAAPGWPTTLRTVALVLLAGAVASPPVHAGRGLAATRALIARLSATGRAEAEVRLERAHPLTGRGEVLRGRLALERPRRARLEFPLLGECLTLREDGGDWLQPGPRQLVRAGVESAAAAMRWWVVLLDSGAAFEERPLPDGAYRVTPAGSGASGAAQLVWLGRDGLPARLEIVTVAGDTQRVALRGWRFSRARGRDAFVLRAPPGFETIEMP
jgi:hypothetical protein